MMSTQHRSGRARRAAAAAAGLVLAAGTMFAALPAGRAYASGTTCGYGDSDGNTQTCLSVTGNSVSSSAAVVNGGAGRTLSSCIHYNGNSKGCTGFSYVPPGKSIGQEIYSTQQLPGGTYCAVTFRDNPDGSSSEIGDNCQTVG